jgi:hypothetical protein
MHLRFMLPLVLLLGGCTESLFVDREIGHSVEKGVDKVAKFGQVEVCYSTTTPWGEVEALAAEECGRLGWQAELYKSTKWQCRISAPHRATFQCYVPGYEDKSGRHFNPSNTKAFLAWKKTQEARGKAPAARGGDPNVPAAAAPPAMSVTPAPAYEARPLLNPGDIAGKPPMSSAPLRVEPAPAQHLFPTPGFTLIPKSWGEHLED